MDIGKFIECNFKVKYSLSLRDGNRWNLAGSSRLAPWMDRFARIMKLEKGDSENSKSLFFFDSNEKDMILDGSDDLSKSLLLPYGDNGKVSPKIIKFFQSETSMLCEMNSEEGDEIVHMFDSLLPVYLDSIRKGGLPFHAGFAELKGKGVLLPAHSTTGKSTCCRRFPEYWRPLCDDEAFVVMDEHSKEYRVHPFPTWSEYVWKKSEKSWDVEYSTPLGALFFLKQSEVDGIEPMGEGRSAIMINQTANEVFGRYFRRLIKSEKRLKEYRELIFENSCSISKKIPAYRLRVSLHGEFWKKIEKVVETI